MPKIANKKIIISEAMNFLLHFVAFIAVIIIIFYLLTIPFEILPRISFDKVVYEYIRSILFISVFLAITLLLYVYSDLAYLLSKIEKKKMKIKNKK